MLRFAHANPALFRLMFSVIPPQRREDELREASRAAFETLRQAVARGWPGGEPDPDSVTRAALRAWALVHGLGQLLLDGQLDWLEERPAGAGGGGAGGHRLALYCRPAPGPRQESP